MVSRINFCDEFLNINNHPSAPRYKNVSHVGMLAPAALGAIKSTPYLKGSFVQYLPIPSNILSGLGVGVLHMTICEELYDKWIDAFFENWGSWQDKSYANRTLRTTLKLAAVALSLTIISYCFNSCGALKFKSYTIVNFSTIPYEKALGYVLINKAMQAFFITVRGPQGFGNKKDKYTATFNYIKAAANWIRIILADNRAKSENLKEKMRVIHAEAELHGNELLKTQLTELVVRLNLIMTDYDAFCTAAGPVIPEINAILNPTAQGLDSLASLIKVTAKIKKFHDSENGKEKAKAVAGELTKIQTELQALDPSNRNSDNSAGNT